MNAELFTSLDLLEKESGISKEYMLEKIEEALANACRKEVGATALIRVHLDPVKCDMKVYHRRLVVPDGEVTDPKVEISLSDAKSMSRRNKLGGVVEVTCKVKQGREDVVEHHAVVACIAADGLCQLQALFEEDMIVRQGLDVVQVLCGKHCRQGVCRAAEQTVGHDLDKVGIKFFDVVLMTLIALFHQIGMGQTCVVQLIVGQKVEPKAHRYTIHRFVAEHLLDKFTSGFHIYVLLKIVVFYFMMFNIIGSKSCPKIYGLIIPHNRWLEYPKFIRPAA